jgi:hypothetical protein
VRAAVLRIENSGQSHLIPSRMPERSLELEDD